MNIARAHAHECIHFALKYFKGLVAIAIGGVDIDIILMVNMKRIIEEHCLGGACTYKHFQVDVKDNCSNLLVLNKKITIALGWDQIPPIGCAVPCKMLRD